MYAIITENDISEWEDRTGQAYHFPKRYIKYLEPGTKVIYYKGGIKDNKFSNQRLSDLPHYFGVADIGKHYPDPKSKKGDLFSFIENYQPFEHAVPNKINDLYLEEIPPSKTKNYWRDGVREISKDTFNKILSHAKLNKSNQLKPAIKDPIDNDIDQKFESRAEGSKTLVLTTKYERDPKLRSQAILIHGDSCKVCGFNFSEFYGEYGNGYIHIHHIKPISRSGGNILVNPETDLIPLCANCHAIIHRKKDNTLTIDELKVHVKNAHDTKVNEGS